MMMIPHFPKVFLLISLFIFSPSFVTSSVVSSTSAALPSGGSSTGFVSTSAGLSSSSSMVSGDSIMMFEPRTEWCVSRPSNLLREPCDNSSVPIRLLGQATRLQYEMPELPFVECNSVWIRVVLEDGALAYVSSIDKCENVASPPTSPSTILPIPVWIGIGVGAYVLFICIPILIICVLRRRRNSSSAFPKSSRKNSLSGPNTDTMLGRPGKGSAEVELRDHPPHRRSSRASSRAGHLGFQSQSLSGTLIPGNSTGNNNARAPNAYHPSPSKSGSFPGSSAGMFATTQGKSNASVGSNGSSGSGASRSDAVYWGADFLSSDRLQVEKEIGRGGYGVVYKGYFDGKEVAIKAMTEGLSPKEMSDFLQECKLLTKVPRHPNVVQLEGISQMDGNIVVVLEFLSGGSLLSYIESPAEFTRNMVLDWLANVANGMSHLRKHNVIHRDLAARNILLTESLVAKVTDFGMSRVVGQGSTDSAHVTKSNVGPLKWMAPESLLDKIWSEKTDIWSFGVLGFEIIAREEPYNGLEPVQVAAQVCRDGIVLEPPSTYGQDIVDILHKCMSWEPTDRPTFADLYAMIMELPY